MKILCISQYFTPDVTAAAYRISETVDLLRADGHEVFVITSYPHKSEVSLSEDVEQAETHVIRLPVNAIRGSGVRDYMEQYLGFAMRSLFAAMRLRKKLKVDVVWASSPPLFVGITTLLLRLFYRVPVVFDIRDLWPASAVDIGKIRSGSLMERGGRWLELMIYRHSSALTCVSDSIRSHITARTERPVEIVYNGVLMKNVRHAVDENVSPKTICYAGNLGHAQGLEIVLAAFERLVKTSGHADCRLLLIGGGAVEVELKESVRQRGMSGSVVFAGVLSKGVVFGKLEKCGVLLIPLMDTKTFENAIPSKIFDYMAVGNPIIATVRGEAAVILEKSGGNLVVPPGDVNALYLALCEMQQSWPQYAEQAKNNIPQVKQSYSREAATAVLERVLQTACKGKSR